MSVLPVAASVAAQIPAETAPVVEAKPAAPAPEELLAKREKAIRQQAQKLQMEKQKWEAERKKYETDYVPKEKLKSDWLGVLEQQGLTHEQIAQHLLNTPNDPQTKAIMAKINALEESQANAMKQAEQQQLEQFEQVKKQMSTDVKQLIASDTTYEMMKATPGAEDAVLELIIEDFEKTGVLKDIDEVCAEYETYLVEEAYKLAQLPKVQAKFKPTQAATPEGKTHRPNQRLNGLQALTR